MTQDKKQNAEWKQKRLKWQADKKIRMEKRMPFIKKEISKLMNSGHKVVEINSFQYRIDDCVDIFPHIRKYHIFKKNLFGRYEDIFVFLNNPIAAKLMEK